MNKQKLYFILTLLLCLFFSRIQAQQCAIDSILKLNKTTKVDSIKINTFLLLSGLYSNQNPDSAIIYAKKAVDFAKKNKNQLYLAKSYSELGWNYYLISNYSEALKNYFEALRIDEKLNNPLLSSTLGNIGAVYLEQKDFTKALEYYYKALQKDEAFKNKSGIAIDYSNIGISYMEQGNYEKALEYYHKALKIDEERGNKREISIKLGNIGNVYYTQAESIKTNLLQRDSLYNSALEYYFRALKIDKELGRNNGIAIKYGNIGCLYKKTKKYKQAEEYLQKALNLSDSIGALNLSMNWHEELSYLYEKTNNHVKALEHFKQYIAVRDSIYNEDNLKKTTQLEMSFEFEKKEAVTQAVYNKQIALAEAEKKKQQIIIWAVGCGLLFVIVFASFVFYSLQITKKQKVIIEKQKRIVDNNNISLNELNEELNSQNEEILTQRDEIEAKRDQLSDQNIILAHQKKEITDSITYAKRIQQAMLPSGEYANGLLGEHFILFKPKDIVSGDFYWGIQINEWLIVTVADCTGHGVPGAFMSMLGISFLNEIVRKSELTNASHILNHLRIAIMDALKQKGLSGEQKDGMDISLVAINKNSNHCFWAGANNPLYIVKSHAYRQAGEKLKVKSEEISTLDFQLSNLELIELKGDKMPVSIHIKMEDFTNHEFDLSSGDRLFLFSDGFPDQFGGSKGRKFMYNEFKRLLIETSTLTMKEQGEAINVAYENWVNNDVKKYEQIDDITVLGLKI